MRFQVGAMSVGDILDRGLKLLLARLPVFYAINLIVLAPTLVVQLALPVLQAEPSAAPGGAQVAALLGGGLLVLILTLILAPIGNAAVLHIIAQEFIDQRAGIGEAFRFAFHSFGRLLGASILAGLITGLGFVLCFVPGVLFAIWYVFVGQVVVVEGLKGASALSRSKDLTSGYRGRVVGLFGLYVVMMLILGAAAGLLERFLPGVEVVMTQTGPKEIPNYANHAIQIVLSTLVNILVQTYLAVCLTLLYFDLRIRKEGFDLELAAKQQAAVVS